MIKIDIITIFPEIFVDFLKEGLLAKGIKKNLLKVNLHYLRHWTQDRHQTVDDRPYGGGVGMVMKVEPIYKAVKAIVGKKKNVKKKIILFSPRGEKFDQKMAERFSKLDQMVLICGRYEGVDERVAEHIADEIVSVGDYILSGGELPAMVVVETISRLIPGVIGKTESVQKENHAQYTRPEIFKAGGKKWSVPRVLLSGDHEKIKKWRKGNG